MNFSLVKNEKYWSSLFYFHQLLNKRLILLSFILAFLDFTAIAQDWNFIKGLGKFANYGSQGIAATSNAPGARQRAVSWESGGKMYLFGGIGIDASGSTGFLNDLWEYDPATNNWRWLKGSNTKSQASTYGTQGAAASNNTPGARQSALSWESGGKLYLFGGYGYDASGPPSGANSLNDLWEYDLSTNNWRWLKGGPGSIVSYGTQGIASPSNTPGARHRAVSWESGGKFYLFGGNPSDTTQTHDLFSDLWEYDPATNDWRWLKGSNTLGIGLPTYGTQGIAASGNTPGGREWAVSWVSGTKLYLFGGYNDFTGVPYYLEDLWEYDLTTNNWRWLKGSNAVTNIGTYGTKGTEATSNNPGPRNKAMSWASGEKFYLFGGYGYDANRSSGYLNDLWEYNPATNNWRWLKGSNIVDQSSIFTTQGTAEPNNTPGARQSAVTWESGGKIYLFGGLGIGSAGNETYLSDLWESILPTSVLPVTWLYFSGQVKQEGVELKWATATEKNTVAFMLERSDNGLDFSMISEIAASGNSSSEQSYKFFDGTYSLAGKVAYYRLRQVDLDGSESFSKIIAISKERHQIISLSPNPFNEELSIQLSSLPRMVTDRIVILTLEGKLVYEEALVNYKNDTIKLNKIKNLPVGFYLMQIFINDEFYNFKVIKE